MKYSGVEIKPQQSIQYIIKFNGVKYTLPSTYAARKLIQAYVKKVPK